MARSVKDHLDTALDIVRMTRIGFEKAGSDILAYAKHLVACTRLTEFRTK